MTFTWRRFESGGYPTLSVLFKAYFELTVQGLGTSGPHGSVYFFDKEYDRDGLLVEQWYTNIEGIDKSVGTHTTLAEAQAAVEGYFQKPE